MASLSDFPKASRKLGDIYSQGLLGVAKDEDMAIFCWEQATHHRDTVAGTSAAYHHLLSPHLTWDDIQDSLSYFSTAITINFKDGTDTMKAAVLDRKQKFQTVLAAVLQGTHAQSRSKEKESDCGQSEEREPEGLSWNLDTLANHTLHTIHLLELAQTPEFQQKLETIPNWKEQLKYTNRLVSASNSCNVGLSALQKLNVLYREAVIKSKSKAKSKGNSANARDSEWNRETEYPPNLRLMPQVDQNTLAKEQKLVEIIVASFADSIKMVGAAFLGDKSTLSLIQRFIESSLFNHYHNRALFNVLLLLSYFAALTTPDFIVANHSERTWHKGGPFSDSSHIIQEAAVQGTLGKFEEVVGDMEVALTQLRCGMYPDPDQVPDMVKSKCDLFFVQALCCKSAALTRGVNSAHRKKVKEAMDLFEKFLSICPKDEPRRAEAHYQLALCTLYLKEKKVKGQVTSSAKDILAKVRLLVTQGEEAEQDLPWIDFCPPHHQSHVKRILQQKIRELENSRGQNGKEGPKIEGISSFGGFMSPWFKISTSALALKLGKARGAQVVVQFRKFFKAACDRGIGSPAPSQSSQPLESFIQHKQLLDLLRLPGSPFGDTPLYTRSTFAGLYEIVEPVVHCPVISTSTPSIQDEPEMRMSMSMSTAIVYTVVQDDGGAVSKLRFNLKNREEGSSGYGQIGPFCIGARIIINRPYICLEPGGGTYLSVSDADTEIFHLLPSSVQQQQEKEGEAELRMERKCGFCRTIGETLKRCTRCQVVYYCNQDCQRADWTELKHQWICPYLPPPRPLVVSLSVQNA